MEAEKIRAIPNPKSRQKVGGLCDVIARENLNFVVAKQFSETANGACVAYRQNDVVWKPCGRARVGNCSGVCEEGFRFW